MDEKLPCFVYCGCVIVTHIPQCKTCEPPILAIDEFDEVRYFNEKPPFHPQTDTPCP